MGCMEQCWEKVKASLRHAPGARFLCSLYEIVKVTCSWITPDRGQVHNERTAKVFLETLFPKLLPCFGIEKITSTFSKTRARMGLHYS